MSDYKVTKVSQEPPREWNSPNGGTIYYHKVMVEGWPKAISVGKKVANSLNVGDVLSGDITVDAGHPEDKFKATPKPFGGGFRDGSTQGTGMSNPKPAYQPKDEHAIAKAVALKAAVEAAGHTKLEISDEGIIETAERFLKWLEDGSTTPSQPEKSSVEQFTGKDEPQYEDSFGGEEIDISQIPF